MNKIIHYNYCDNSGRVFCKKEHKIISLEGDTKCDKCDYCFGSLQGEGVECIWEDVTSKPIMAVVYPQKELLRVSKLVDQDIIKKG